MSDNQREILLPGGVKLAFTWCPPGTFLMGSPETEMERGSNEFQHQVTLTQGFWMGIHPVTQAQWKAVMKSNPSHFQGVDLPVENISWDDCQRFCEKLRNETGMSLRLPTEAEWEYAARGGTQTPFYWGDQLNGTQANCDGDFPNGTILDGPYLGQTSTVGQYANAYPHPWGLTDVIGNVWEWCADCYEEDYSKQSPNQDPQGPKSGSDRVVRGGSWYNDAWFCRVAYRNGSTPDYRNFNLGFRLAAGPTELHG